MKFTIAIAIASASSSTAFVQNSRIQKISSIQGYLDDIGGGAPSPNKNGITNYLDSIPSQPTRTAGAGIGSYLDNVNQACDATPTSECAEAITDYMGALSTGDEPASSTVQGAQTIGNYLDNMLKRNVLQGGPGITSYLDAVATAPERQGGAGIGNYLDSVPSVTAITNSAPAVKVSFLCRGYRLLFCVNIDTRRRWCFMLIYYGTQDMTVFYHMDHFLTCTHHLSSYASLGIP